MDPVLLLWYASNLAASDRIQYIPGEVLCPRCLGRDIVPSLPRGWRDALMRKLGKLPRHCRACSKRFYARPGPIEAPPRL